MRIFTHLIAIRLFAGEKYFRFYGIYTAIIFNKDVVSQYLYVCQVWYQSNKNYSFYKVLKFLKNFLKYFHFDLTFKLLITINNVRNDRSDNWILFELLVLNYLI